MRLKAYAILWDKKLGNVKLHQKIELKKMPKKGKDWNKKKMPKWEKNVMRKMKNGLPNINLPIYTI